METQSKGYPIYPSRMVSLVVGNMHVATPDREVIRAMRERCARNARGLTVEMREERHRIYRHALAAHWQNRQICRDFRL